mgnify:CR=1 FL=1
MKTTESFVHKNLRAVAQASVRKEASEPCSLFWSYQPHQAALFYGHIQIVYCSEPSEGDPEILYF